MRVQVRDQPRGRQGYLPPDHTDAPIFDEWAGKPTLTDWVKTTMRDLRDAELASQFVDKHYQPNWETEELIYRGDELRNGMTVLIAYSNNRYDTNLKHIRTADMIDALMQVRLRWCEISRVKVHDDRVYFLATYEDGTQHKRSYPIHTSWLAKKNINTEAEVRHDYAMTAEPQPNNRLLPEEEIRNRFGYHKPATEHERALHVRLRLFWMRTVRELDELLPPNREKSKMLDWIEMAAMYSHKSVAMLSEVSDE